VCVDLQSIRNERERKREQEGSEKSSRHGKDGSANPGNPAASVPLELMTVIGEAKSVIKSVQDARRMPAARVSLPAKGPHMSASRDRIADPREDLLIGACGSLLAADSRLRDSEVSEEIRRRSRTVPKPQSVHISNISAPRKLFAGLSTPPMLQYSLFGFEPGPASQKDQDIEWAEHDGKHAVTDTRTLHVRTSVVVVPPVALETPNGHQLARLAPDVHMSLDSELELTNERRGFKPAFAEMKPLVVSRTKGGATEVPFARFGQSRATDSRMAGDGTLPEISVIRKRTKMPSDAFNFSLFATGGGIINKSEMRGTVPPLLREYNQLFGRNPLVMPQDETSVHGGIGQILASTTSSHRNSSSQSNSRPNSRSRSSSPTFPKSPKALKSPKCSHFKIEKSKTFQRRSGTTLNESFVCPQSPPPWVGTGRVGPDMIVSSPELSQHLVEVWRKPPDILLSKQYSGTKTPLIEGTTLKGNERTRRLLHGGTICGSDFHRCGDRDMGDGGRSHARAQSIERSSPDEGGNLAPWNNALERPNHFRLVLTPAGVGAGVCGDHGFANREGAGIGGDIAYTFILTESDPALHSPVESVVAAERLSLCTPSGLPQNILPQDIPWNHISPWISKTSKTLNISGGRARMSQRRTNDQPEKHRQSLSDNETKEMVSLVASSKRK